MDFGRVMTAMITPMHEDLSVNYEAAQELAAYLLDHGSDALVVCGTTGESPTLTKDEKLKFELQQKLDRKSYTLSQQNKAYKQYCKDNGLKEYAERLRVARWNREQAAKAAGAARRYQNAKGE